MLKLIRRLIALARATAPCRPRREDLDHAGHAQRCGSEHPSRALFLAAMAVVALLTACSSVDKGGRDTLVLQLATIDQVNDNGQSYGPQAFVDSLGEVSGGRLRVEVTTDYGDGAPEAESNLIQAIAAGELDGGHCCVGVRAGPMDPFVPAGIRSGEPARRTRQRGGSLAERRSRGRRSPCGRSG